MIRISVAGSDRPALVDDEFSHLAKYRWRLNHRGYVFRYGDRKVYLHRAVVGVVSDGLVCDHINRDKLDNRRANLRMITPAANAQNLNARRGSTSNHRGVFWDRSRRRWVASVRHNGKNYNFGRFDSEEAAAKAAREGRRKLLPYSYEEVSHGCPRPEATA